MHPNSVSVSSDIAVFIQNIRRRITIKIPAGFSSYLVLDGTK
jgi:hypothetical protein